MVLTATRGRNRPLGAWPQGRAALALWVAAVIGALLAAIPISTSPTPNAWLQLLDLVRIVATTALTFVLVMGPGLLYRLRSSRRLPLGVVPLPGIAWLAVTGIAAWGIGRLGWVHPAFVSTVLLAPVLLAMPAVLLNAERDDLLDRHECWAVGIALLALGLAIARSLWSLSPPNELYAGQIYRTLEPDGIPDSRISFAAVEMIANGLNPFGTVGRAYFLPYDWSSRGPIAALVSAPIILITGGHPPLVIGAPVWTPFDREGFMAYRLVMMTLSGTVMLSAWSLVRRIAGVRAASFAILLLATTPVIINSLWFTWPKLFAVSLLMLAALALLDGRPLAAGACVAVGYLIHPIALLGLPFLAVIALSPAARRPKLHRRVLDAVLVLIAPVLVFEFWKWFNEPFYLPLTGAWKLANPMPPGMTTATVSWWFHDRGIELANMVVPLREGLMASKAAPLESIYGPSAGVVSFYFQYWFTLPFGVGITFFPLLISSIGRSLRRWPWATLLLVVGQLVELIVYWGNDTTTTIATAGLLFVVTLIALVAVQQHAVDFDWLGVPWIRALMVVRVLEIFLLAIVPTVATIHRVYGKSFVLSDVVAMLGLIACSVTLGVIMWRRPTGPSPREPAPSSG